LNNYNTKHNAIFYGRRKGRKLSKSSKLAIINGKNYIIKKEDLANIFNFNNHIILEIGFGDGTNLINSAKINPELFYIGADPFLNATAKCLNKLLLSNLKNVVIWPDDIRNILNDFPYNSISEIKLLFPDPWPKTKHQSRRLIQNTLIEKIYQILKPRGSITIATDHDVLKNWILEKFQRYKDFEWIAKSSKDWQSRPSDCFKTKYESKSILQKRKPSWFIFIKK
jgi:tRNA (guanine-N7-)-methyltransferase